MKFSNLLLIFSLIVLAIGAGLFIYRTNTYNTLVNSWGNNLTTSSLWLHPNNPAVKDIKQVELFRGYIITARNNENDPEQVLMSLSNIKFSNVDTDVDFILPTKVRTGEAYSVTADPVSGTLQPRPIITSLLGELFQAKQIDIELQYELGHTSYEEINKIYLYFNE